MRTTTIAAVAGAFMALPMVAGAATVQNGGDISAGDLGIGSGFAEAGETLSFTYTATEDLRVEDFVSFSSVGFSSGDDLVQVSYGIDSDGAGSFSSSYTFGDLSINGTTTEANASVSGFTLLAGQSFSLFFNYGASGSETTSHQYSFTTTEVAAVPVPAAGLLLLTALGGAAAMRRRKMAS